jgi:nicotinamidase-related amidase
VLVIDLQRDFLDSDGWFARVIGSDPAVLREVIGPVQQLVAAARSAGIPVIHTRRGAPIGSARPLGRALVWGEPGWEICHEVAPVAGDYVIDRPGFGAFRGTPLLELLGSLGTTHLVPTGVTANVCVLSTLLEAVDRGFDCLTVTDAVAAVDTELRDRVLDLIRYPHGLFGALAPTATVVAGYSRVQS